MPFKLFEPMYAAAASLLPAKMNTLEAKAMIYAIGLQESRLEHRRQMNGGPARGFLQFEAGGGVHAVLTHEQTRDHIRVVCEALGYKPDTLTCWYAIEHNDVLAFAFGRLLLYSLPQRLPGREETQLAYRQYLAAWRPGRPHPDTWDTCYRRAWESAV